jgi:chromosome segregation ATPase
MSSWLEWFRALYPVVVTLVSLSGLGVFLWLASKFVTKADHKLDQEKASQRIFFLEKLRSEHETRLSLLEEMAKASPTRQELHTEIADLSERMSSVEAGLRSIGKQLGTTNNLLQTLLDNAIQGARK